MADATVEEKKYKRKFCAVMEKKVHRTRVLKDRAKTESRNVTFKAIQAITLQISCSGGGRAESCLQRIGKTRVSMLVGSEWLPA